ncbi:kelch repeat protein [Cooperia oncophora]
MKFPRCDAGVAVLDNLLYVVGGRNSKHYMNSIERY